MLTFSVPGKDPLDGRAGAPFRAAIREFSVEKIPPHPCRGVDQFGSGDLGGAPNPTMNATFS
ncbi:hypothetical protein [Nonomuraea polychroma]|uniref:hypothetical protein n=1 Tax=Nonomuraea polychroma TaxID=46176 RepID=UPI0019D4D124|nr:hypothetical protein [Nonomuraea polychroma]